LNIKVLVFSMSSSTAKYKNLLDWSAPDKPGDTEATTIRLRSEDLEWLRSQPHSVSYQIRQAIKIYRKNIDLEGAE
jgi:hypothetical protein